MEACRRIADGVGNACHEDMVGWRGGIPRTEDRRFQIVWARALFVMRRNSMFAFPHQPRPRVESSREDPNRTRKSRDSDIYPYFIAKIAKRESNLRFDRIKTMIRLKTRFVFRISQSSCKDSCRHSLLYRSRKTIASDCGR